MNPIYAIKSVPGQALAGDYLSCVYARWLRSLRNGNDYFKLIDADCYYGAYKKYIAQVLSRPETTARFAVLIDDDDVVLGWCVFEHPSILHYVHVEKSVRGIGIARSLVEVKPVQYITHLTKVGMTLWPKLGEGVKFDPFR